MVTTRPAEVFSITDKTRRRGIQDFGGDSLRARASRRAQGLGGQFRRLPPRLQNHSRWTPATFIGSAGIPWGRASEVARGSISIHRGVENVSRMLLCASTSGHQGQELASPSESADVRRKTR